MLHLLDVACGFDISNPSLSAIKPQSAGKNTMGNGRRRYSSPLALSQTACLALLMLGVPQIMSGSPNQIYTLKNRYLHIYNSSGWISLTASWRRPLNHHRIANVCGTQLWTKALVCWYLEIFSMLYKHIYICTCVGSLLRGHVLREKGSIRYVASIAQNFKFPKCIRYIPTNMQLRSSWLEGVWVPVI